LFQFKFDGISLAQVVKVELLEVAAVKEKLLSVSGPDKTEPSERYTVMTRMRLGARRPERIQTPDPLVANSDGGKGSDPQE
jgi:hypothetical protein